jgi:hypothetical protein
MAPLPATAAQKTMSPVTTQFKEQTKSISILGQSLLHVVREHSPEWFRLSQMLDSHTAKSKRPVKSQQMSMPSTSSSSTTASKGTQKIAQHAAELIQLHSSPTSKNTDDPDECSSGVDTDIFTQRLEAMFASLDNITIVESESAPNTYAPDQATCESEQPMMLTDVSATESHTSNLASIPYVPPKDNSKEAVCIQHHASMGPYAAINSQLHKSKASIIKAIADINARIDNDAGKHRPVVEDHHSQQYKGGNSGLVRYLSC